MRTREFGHGIFRKYVSFFSSAFKRPNYSAVLTFDFVLRMKLDLDYRMVYTKFNLKCPFLFWSHSMTVIRKRVFRTFLQFSRSELQTSKLIFAINNTPSYFIKRLEDLPCSAFEVFIIQAHNNTCSYERNTWKENEEKTLPASQFKYRYEQKIPRSIVEIISVQSEGYLATKLVCVRYKKLGPWKIGFNSI